MKIAIAHDSFTQLGGAERVVDALHDRLVSAEAHIAMLNNHSHSSVDHGFNGKPLFSKDSPTQEAPKPECEHDRGKYWERGSEETRDLELEAKWAYPKCSFCKPVPTPDKPDEPNMPCSSCANTGKVMYDGFLYCYRCLPTADKPRKLAEVLLSADGICGGAYGTMAKAAVQAIDTIIDEYENKNGLDTNAYTQLKAYLYDRLL